MADQANGTYQFDTDHAAAVVVIGALVLLILLRRGFRGVGVPGVGAVRVG